MSHQTIAQLEANLAKIGAGAYGPTVTHAYCETGRYKPYAEATMRAAKARGYRVEKRCAGVYHVYPKAPAAAPVVKLDDAAWATETKADGSIVEADTGAVIVPTKTAAQEAIETADAHLDNAVLPTYSELLAIVREMTPRFEDLREVAKCQRESLLGAKARALLTRHDRTMAGDFGPAAGYRSAEAAERRMGC